MTGFVGPEELARAAFIAYVAGDSRALRDMTHPDAARQYHSFALTYLPAWHSLEEIQRAVESAAHGGGIVSSVPHDAQAQVQDFPLYHLPGVSSYRDITVLDPEDFLERAFAGGAEAFGYPSRPDQWQPNDRFELRGTITWEADIARVPYVHTEKETDGPDSERIGELVAKTLEGDWRLWFDRGLFTPVMLFLHE